MSRPLVNSTQVAILRLLMRHPNGLTRSDISRHYSASYMNLGPSYQDSLSNPDYSRSLYALGLVKPAQDYTNGPVNWVVTPKGAWVASAFQGTNKGIKVPHEILDPLVMNVLKARTYSVDYFTSEDIDEVRKSLPQKFKEIEVDQLRQQIITRRKLGAYTKHRKPRDKAKLAVARLIREFGPEGDILSLLTPAQLRQLDYFLSQLEQPAKT